MENQSKVKYKIRDMVTGLYQKDKLNIYVRPADVMWSERGKTWKNIESLREHFAMIQDKGVTISPLWEVVEFESAKKEIASYPAAPVASMRAKRS